jgi:type I restriction enzyme R subunit
MEQENDNSSFLDGPFLDGESEIDIHNNHLPHWQQGDVWVFVTWRMKDSLPKWKIARWNEEREIWRRFHPPPWDEKTAIEYSQRFPNRMERWLDRGEGECFLGSPKISSIMAETLMCFDGTRYQLAAFVVMPNHVHVLFRPVGEYVLSEIVGSWKGFSAKRINANLRRTGSLWQADYWDRLIRSSRHFIGCLKYIRANPTKANLREGQFVLYENQEWGVEKL